MTGHTDQTGSPRSAVQRMLRPFIRIGFLPLVMVALSLVFVLYEPRYFTLQNLANVLIQSSFLIVLSVAQLLALLVRGFDLSVGQLVSMISVTSALVMAGLATSGTVSPELAVIAGLAAGLLTGAVVGIVNGFNISVLGVHPFVATLGMQGVGLGIASTVSGGFPVFDVPRIFPDMFLNSSLLGIPVPIVIAALVCAIVSLMLNHTVFGRLLYIIGSNPQAAVTAGIQTRISIIGAYAGCSVITAIAALMLTARTGSGEPLMGGGLMLQCIAAAVIGGVSLRGGEGRVGHCILGAVFITMLSNGMNMIRVEGYFQMVALGIVVIAGIFIDRLRHYVK